MKKYGKRLCAIGLAVVLISGTSTAVHATEQKIEDTKE